MISAKFAYKINKYEITWQNDTVGEFQSKYKIKKLKYWGVRFTFFLNKILKLCWKLFLRRVGCYFKLKWKDVIYCSLPFFVLHMFVWWLALFVTANHRVKNNIVTDECEITVETFGKQKKVF